MELKAVYMQKKDRKQLCPVDRFGPETAERARQFHRSFPEYRETPLVALDALAAYSGVASIHVKDESFRFGLNAFKALGGSYAIGNYIAQKLEMNLSGLPFAVMTGEPVRRKLGRLTFATATDGNHGRGVAWTANRLKQDCVVRMPAGSAAERLANIRALGADAEITDRNYDDTVRMVKSLSAQNGWVLVQDTAWPGYEEIPGWIMEGYTTMAAEAVEQLGGKLPTHVFLQAGVGSMAAAVAGYFAVLAGEENRPVITIVEPDQADCFYRTAAADDGELHAVTGEMRSIMAGLCCGEPSPLAWELLRDHADCFVSMPDSVAMRGMRILGNPLDPDQRVISGESGASAFGLAAEVLLNPELEELKEKLRLDGNSRILCFSTEGATDRKNYRRIVWGEGLRGGNY